MENHWNHQVTYPPSHSCSREAGVFATGDALPGARELPGGPEGLATCADVPRGSLEVGLWLSVILTPTVCHKPSGLLLFLKCLFV